MIVKHSIFLDLKNIFSLLVMTFVFSFIFSACSSTEFLRISPFYYFDYNGENYRIRSISSSDKTQSRNELIGNHFLAVDIDQDGTMDQIVLGKIELTEAQKIYDYALTLLANENKLREINPDIDTYEYVNTEYTYEITTFRPANGRPFNQFKIISNYHKAKQIPIVMIDSNADGKLDAVLKGNVAVDKFQRKYDEILQLGLQNNAFVRVDSKILLKER